jgi:hypothetical protein
MEEEEKVCRNVSDVIVHRKARIRTDGLKRQSW